jgi:hypothetical protein
VHDTTERPPGRLADHQLDVTARDLSGDVRRLLVESKDWSKTVGQGTLNTLVGVRFQVGADAAAIVITQGYKERGRLVAADGDVALLRLRAFDPENQVSARRRIDTPSGSVHERCESPHWAGKEPYSQTSHEILAGRRLS